MEFLEFLAEWRTGAGDVFFQIITYLAQEMFVIAVICWLFWCSNKKLAYSLGFSYFSSGLLVQGLKISFRVPRPWVLNPEFKAVESAVAGATGYSFPSGHTQSCTALFGTFGFHAGKVSSKILCGVMIFLVGFSRMYLGCHTPKDVIVSFILSIGCTAGAYYLLYRKEVLDGHEKGTAIAMAVICGVLIVYTYVLYSRGTIEIKYASDCVKAAGAGTAFAVGYYIERTRIKFEAPKEFKDKIKRFVIGLIGAGVFQAGLKPIIGTSLTASFIRYFIVVLWVVVVYPTIFKRYSNKEHAGRI